MLGAYGKGHFPYGKGFAVYCSRQTIHGKQMSAKGIFTVCYFLGTQQRVCRVLKSTRQRFFFFRKPIFKNMKQKTFNSRRTPPASHSPTPSNSQVTAFFMHYAAGGIRTCDLSLTCNLLYHCTTLSLVSILHFLSPHIILNRV